MESGRKRMRTSKIAFASSSEVPSTSQSGWSNFSFKDIFTREESNSSSSSNQSSIDGDDCLLLRLPPEILRVIFETLCPFDLVSLEELDIPRISALTSEFRIAELYQLKSANPRGFSAFFTNARVENLTVLKLFHLYFIPPLVLTNGISKCYQLKVLSVLKCDVDYKSICIILKGCSSIEELHWNLLVSWCGTGSYYIPESAKRNLKILDLKVVNFPFCTANMLEGFINLEEILLDLHFNQYNPSQVWLTLRMIQLNFPKLKSFLIKLSGVRFFESVNGLTYFIEEAVASSGNRLEKFWLDSELYYDDTMEDFELENVPAISSLQLLNEEKVERILSTVPANTMQALGVGLCESFPESLGEIIQRAGGTNLQTFVVYQSRQKPGAEKNIGVIRCASILNEIFSVCHNIKSLDIEKVQFDESEPFPGIGHLKGLKELRIPPKVLCLITNVDFEAMVEKCNQVELFSLVSHVQSVPVNENILMAIGQWQNLKHLILKSVISFRTCNFLCRVASGCPNLISLQIENVGHESVCHYIPSVLHIVRKCKKLKFLKIKQAALYLGNTHLWSAITGAKELLGLCLATKSESNFPSTLIERSCSKLPYLNCCHIVAPKITPSLRLRMKHAMETHGIKTKKVSLNQICTFDECDCDSYFVPSFSPFEMNVQASF